MCADRHTCRVLSAIIWKSWRNLFLFWENWTWVLKYMQLVLPQRKASLFIRWDCQNMGKICASPLLLWIKEIESKKLRVFSSIWWIGTIGNNNLSSLWASHSCTYPPYATWTNTLWLLPFSFSSSFPRSLSLVPFVYSGSYFPSQAVFPEGEASEGDIFCWWWCLLRWVVTRVSW